MREQQGSASLVATGLRNIQEARFDKDINVDEKETKEHSSLSSLLVAYRY